jgi:hypothetical protein
VEQYSDEIYRFHDPSTNLNWAHTNGMNADDRLKALSDPSTHIVITTPEALRGDITAAVARHQGITPEQARDKIMTLPEDERHAMIHRAMDEAGMNFDMTVADEGHRLSGRRGKPDAHMQRIADAIIHKTPYAALMTADPARNGEPSEAWDSLHKLDPARYPDGSQGAFERKYGRSTVASGLALQKVMAPYTYADALDMGIDDDHSVINVDLTDDQQKEHDEVLGAYAKARQARLRGSYDLASLKRLSPGSFTPGSDEGAIAQNLNKSLGTTRDSAIARVVNSHSAGAKEDAVSKYLGERKGQPAVVFCRSLDGVKGIAARLKAEGHRVGTITGSMNAKAKDAARHGFYPPEGQDAATDVLVCSDAAAMGGNLQRGIHCINVDVPHTAMIEMQRKGRIRRPGQKSNVTHTRDIVSNTDFDKKARKRIETKGQMREIMTSPMAGLDDDGLAEAVESAGIRDVLRKAAK